MTETSDTTTKVCFRCGEDLPIDQFYVHPKMADGHLNKCIDCTKADATRHRNENLDAIREYDRERAKSDASKSRRRQYQTQSRIEHPERWHARAAAAYAKKKGIIKPTPCHFCGATDDLEMHHPDYNKPLRVYWLCRVCHRRLDAMLKL